MLQRGEATRNSTGNAAIKRPPVKLSRTSSDTRRCQDMEMPLRVQSRAQQQLTRTIAVKPVVTKKDDIGGHHRVDGPLKPLTVIMQRAMHGSNHKKVLKINKKVNKKSTN